MAHTACIVCLITAVSGWSKKKLKIPLEDVALVVGT
jgi:hypothetical protein